IVSRPLGNDFAAQPNAAQWLERVTKASLDYVFERKCTYCHQTESYATVKKVDPIAGRFPSAGPWLERGEFSHRAHRAVVCESCHTTARASAKTEDVLIPAMKTCLPCHGESRAGLDRCSECHQYHNRSLERERERRSTEELIGLKGRGLGLGVRGWGSEARFARLRPTVMERPDLPPAPNPQPPPPVFGGVQ
ncbi:MAG TPA: hypothetical protein VGH38_00530, partial [Bryobacteraceae bacterium]